MVDTGDRFLVLQNINALLLGNKTGHTVFEKKNLNVDCVKSE